MKNRIYIIVLMLCFGHANFAQDGEGLGSENIIVIKEYEARIADAQKINTNPTSNEVEVEKQSLEYRIEEKLISLKYPPHTVKPLAIPKLKPVEYLNSYIKLGFGFHLGDNKKVYYSPLAEIVYNNHDSKNLIYGGHYKHFSALGSRSALQKFRNEDAKLYAQYAFKKVELGIDAGFKQNQDLFYGLPSDTIIDANQIRQVVNSYGANLYLKNGILNDKKLDYKNTLGFSFLNDAFDSKEWFVDYDGSITKGIEKFHSLELKYGTYISNYIPTTKDDLEREYFNFGTAYTFNNDDWKLKVGADLAIGEATYNKQWDLYPILELEKKLFKDHLIVYGSWSRALKVNSYKSLVEENPYININPELRNSRVEDRKGGFKGSIKNFSYNAQISNKVIKDLPLYLNDTLQVNRFNVVHEDLLNIIKLKTELGFSWTKRLKTLFNIDYNIYNGKSQEGAWSLPRLNANLSAFYKIKSQYLINLEIFSIYGARSRNSLGEEVILKGSTEFNLGFVYKHSKHLDIYIKVSNLADSKQERFYNYRDFGFNALLGVKFEF